MAFNDVGRATPLGSRLHVLTQVTATARLDRNAGGQLVLASPHPKNAAERPPKHSASAPRNMSRAKRELPMIGSSVAIGGEGGSPPPKARGRRFSSRCTSTASRAVDSRTI